MWISGGHSHSKVVNGGDPPARVLKDQYPCQNPEIFVKTRTPIFSQCVPETLVQHSSGAEGPDPSGYSLKNSGEDGKRATFRSFLKVL